MVSYFRRAGNQPLILSLLLACIGLTACDALEPQGPPNVLLIVLDDFGVNDLGINGNDKVRTPSLDSFAAQGVHYTRHYADSSCSPARAALLTGNYPAYSGFRPTHLGLSPGTPTIATVLQAAGYHTRHLGKWHVGNPTLQQGPSALGFDRWFGFLFQAALGGPSEDGVKYGRPRYLDPWLRRDNKAPRLHEGHLTDILTEDAIGFIESRNAEDKPWFLNFWYYAPHMPMEPAPRFAARYPKTYEGMYLALVEQVDDAIGRVLQALEDSGQADNTLVIILSDNGGANTFTDSNHPFYGKKAQYLEGGLRTPLLIRWPGQVPAGVASAEMVSLLDILPTIAAVAGASPPAQAVGRDLLAAELPTSPQLFWETIGWDSYNYSVLSLDGRWRYLYDSEFGEVLNDLATEPRGERNVMSDHPQQAARLREDYRLWRRAQREVRVNREVLNERGGARLTGKDVLRSPGMQGFTFAIGVTPEQLGDSGQAILHQGGRWGVYATADATLVGMLGELITLPPLTPGQCSELVITARFGFSPIWPKLNRSLVEVFVDGRKLASVSNDDPVPNKTGYAAPTYIGMSSPGESEFLGSLGQPVILNEKVGLEDSDPILGDSVLDLPPLCR